MNGSIRMCSVALVTLMAALLTALSIAGPAAAQAPNEEVARLMRSFTDCAAGQGAADVVLLLDRSTSLQSSDPENQRAVASRQFVEQLGLYSSESGVAINIKVAGFDGSYRPTDWLLLNPADLDPVWSSLEVAATPDGLETDYWSAFQGANQDFATSGNPDSCKLLVWFTDGKYTINTAGLYGLKPYSSRSVFSDPEGVAQDGRASICSAVSGPVTELRARNVYLVTVALNSQGALDAGDETFLRELSTGEGSCGGALPPDHGAYIPVTAAGDLVFELGTITAEQRAQKPYVDGKSTVTFPLFAFVSKASILADAGVVDGGVAITMTGPDGQSTTPAVGESEFTIAGAAVKTRTVSDRVVSFDVYNPTSGLAGDWNVIFQANNPTAVPAEAFAQAGINVTVDLKLEWLDAVDRANIGDELPVRLQVLGANGQPVQADLPQPEVVVTWSGASTPIKQAPLADFVSGTSIALQAPPLSPSDGNLGFQLRLRPPVAGTDRAADLTSEISTYPLQVRPPGQYPVVSSQAVQLGPEGQPGQTVTGDGQAVGVIPVQGPGCVWLDEAASTTRAAPQGMESFALSSTSNSQDTCLTVSQGEERELPVTLTPATAGTGAALGTATVLTAPADFVDDPLPVTVEYSADFTKPVNRTGFFVTLLAGLVLGLGVPAALLMWTRARSAAIQVHREDFDSLSYVQKNLTVQPDGSIDHFAIQPSEVLNASTGTEMQMQRLSIGDVELAAVPWGNPFRVADVKASRADSVLISDWTPDPSSDGSTRLPLSPQGHWVAWRIGDSAVTVVAFFLSSEANEDSAGELSNIFAESLQSNGEALARLVQDGAGAPVPVGVGADDGAAGGTTTAVNAETSNWGSTTDVAGWGDSPEAGGDWAITSDDWGSSGWDSGGDWDTKGS